MLSHGKVTAFFIYGRCTLLMENEVFQGTIPIPPFATDTS